jgi:hypothetical protein
VAGRSVAIGELIKLQRTTFEEWFPTASPWLFARAHYPRRPDPRTDEQKAAEYKADARKYFDNWQTGVKRSLALLREERLERIASEQLSALIISGLLSYDSDGLAERAVGLAQSLADKLDEESST